MELKLNLVNDFDEIINILKDMPLRECEFEKLKQIEVLEESIE